MIWGSLGTTRGDCGRYFTLNVVYKLLHWHLCLGVGIGFSCQVAPEGAMNAFEGQILRHANCQWYKRLVYPTSLDYQEQKYH